MSSRVRDRLKRRLVSADEVRTTRASSAHLVLPGAVLVPFIENHRLIAHMELSDSVPAVAEQMRRLLGAVPASASAATRPSKASPATLSTHDRHELSRTVVEGLRVLADWLRDREATRADAAAVASTVDAADARASEQALALLAAPTAAPQRRSACDHCGAEGDYEVNARDGDLVCAHCGYVAGRAPGGQLYEAEPKVLPRWRQRVYDAEGQRRMGGGPSARTLQLSRYASWTSQQQRRAEVQREVEHWAYYAQLSAGGIDGAVVDALRLEHCRRDVAIAAALLCRIVALPNLADAEARMRARLPLDVASAPAVRPTFACPHCGSLQHSHKAARHHCRGRRS